MKLLSRLRRRAASLKKEVTALYYAYQDPRTPVYAKVLVFITMAYALSPIDLIPDFIPILGYLDDLILLPALIALSISLIPEPVMREARIRAEKEPLQLRKNWGAALLFILIWALILFYIGKNIIRISGA